MFAWLYRTCRFSNESEAVTEADTADQPHVYLRQAIRLRSDIVRGQKSPLPKHTLEALIQAVEREVVRRQLRRDIGREQQAVHAAQRKINMLSLYVCSASLDRSKVF